MLFNAEIKKVWDDYRVQEETNPGHKLDLIPVDGVTDDRFHFNFTQRMLKKNNF